MIPFLADLDLSRHGIALPIIAVTLSLMIPIVAIITEHFQKKKKMELMEKAIEHGVDISSLDLDGEDRARPRLPYRSGMVTLAVGVALLIARNVTFGGSGTLNALATVGGAICVCVGLALLVNDFMNRDRFRDAGPADRRTDLIR